MEAFFEKKNGVQAVIIILKYINNYRYLYKGLIIWFNGGGVMFLS